MMTHVGNHLRRNGILALLVDQAYISKSLFVPFFGVPCATADGPAKLHLWYEIPIVLVFCIRQNDQKYHVSFEGPYYFDKSDDLRKDCENAMLLINQRYEEIIRKHPDQWFSLLTPRWWDWPDIPTPTDDSVTANNLPKN
jgi:KDO2-lipid IV(A) lauroyltransferase